jgi:hypothetical protein
MQGLDVAAKSTWVDTLISKMRLWLLLFTPFARLPALRRETPFRETPFCKTILVGALADTWQLCGSASVRSALAYSVNRILRSRTLFPVGPVTTLSPKTWNTG